MRHVNLGIGLLFVSSAISILTWFATAPENDFPLRPQLTIHSPPPLEADGGNSGGPTLIAASPEDIGCRAALFLNGSHEVGYGIQTVQMRCPESPPQTEPAQIIKIAN